MHKIIKITEGIITSAIENQLIILLPDGKKMIVLNETATAIFNIINEQECSSEEVVNFLYDQYEIEKDTLYSQVLNVIDSLNEKGVIKLC